MLCKFSEETGTENVDIPLLEDELKKINGVDEVHVLDSLSSEEARKEAVEILSKSGCNRLLAGVSQAYMYRKTLNTIAKQAGFHSMLVKAFDFLGISRQGLGENDAETFTRRIVTEIKAEVASLKELPAMDVQSMPVNQTALIIGGGISGMQSALSLARRGLPVHIVERDDKLGGFAGNNISETIDGLTPIKVAAEMQKMVMENDNITVHLNTQVEKTKGSFGSFESKIVTGENGNITYVHHGATIVATGGEEGKVDEYCYGQSDKIMTQFEMEHGLDDGSIPIEGAEDIVMIQCVGLREAGKKEYCSRVCCMWAISNALRIKKRNPDARIIVLYRDIMTYGFLEQYYTKARETGVIFIPYSLERKPEVEIVDDKPVVKFQESVLDSPMELVADYLVLSTGIAAEPSNANVAKALGVPIDNNGFFQEADSKWRPVEFQKMGTFVAGAAHSPKPMPDVLMQAEAVAQKTFGYLNKTEVKTARITSNIRHAICIRCQLCVSACPFEARTYNGAEHKIEVDAAACQGCGMCAVTCRNNAAQVTGWNDRQLMSVIDAKLDEPFTV